MKLSDLIKCLEYIKEKEGDLPVLEYRQVWYDSWDYFPNNIEIDKKIKTICKYPIKGTHYYNDPKYANKKTCLGYEEFKALIL